MFAAASTHEIQLAASWPATSQAPSMLLIAAAGRDGAREAALATGWRIGQEIVPETLAACDVDKRSDVLFDADAVLVDLTGLDPATAERVLDWAVARAMRDAMALVVESDGALIDLVAGKAGPQLAAQLCAPTQAERALAMMIARPDRQSMLRDPSREAERLRRLNAEVARIAEALARLSREAADAGLREQTRDYVPPPMTGGSDAAVSAADVRRLIRARRLREQFFAADLFADPAWDMLLDLFAAELEQLRVSVSSLCIAAAVPPTTALRWIQTLTEAGLFERRADPLDRRRAFIALSAQAGLAMRGYFAARERLAMAAG